MTAVTLASFLLAGLTVDFSSNPAFFILIALLLATSLFYRFVRPNPYLQAATEIAAQLLLILLLGILLTYAAATVGFPYVDADLYAIDNALGFSRRAYLQFFRMRPWLGDILTFAYQSLLPQLVLVPFVLLLTNRGARVQAFLLAIGIALLLTAGISVFAPAICAYIYVDLGGPAHIPAGAVTAVPTLEALRSGALHVLRLNDLEGLVTFPSFHTAEALLFIWALWPVAYLRWVGLAVNLALIAATPIDGGHYIVDVAGGGLVAFLAIEIAGRMCSRPVTDPAPAAPAVAAPRKP
jgi:membrane-associated phospholipid phosphatase